MLETEGVKSCGSDKCNATKVKLKLSRISKDIKEILTKLLRLEHHKYQKKYEDEKNF